MKLCAGPQILIGLLLSTVAVSWVYGQANDELLRISVYDPLANSRSTFTGIPSILPNLRPIFIQADLAQPGAVATVDRSLSFVYKLSHPYLRREQGTTTTSCPLTIGTGQTSAAAEFVAWWPGPQRYSLGQYFFFETDGNYFHSPQSNRDFGLHYLESARNFGAASEVSFLFVSRDSVLKDHRTLRWQVDLGRRRSDPAFEVALNSPVNYDHPSDGVDLTLPRVDTLWELIDGRFRIGGPAQNTGLTLAPPVSAPSLVTPPVRAQSNAELRENLDQAPCFRAIDPNYFPAQWRALAKVDFIVITRDELANFSAQDNSRALLSLQSWVALGGRLVVTDGAADFRDVAAIHRELFQPLLQADETLWPARWMRFDAADDQRVRELTAALAVDQYRPDSHPSAYYSAARLEGGVWEAGSAAPPRLLLQDHLLGRIIVCPKSTSQFDSSDWAAILGAAYLGQKATSPSKTIGEGHLAGSWLNDFRVPGVGQPPRLLFLFLIGLFAILIGPVAYFVLYRQQRISFLVVVVPGVSAAFTLGLLFYAILADGLTFRVARFSFTRLDNRSGTALTITEQAVFSGTNPREYRFGPQQLVTIPARSEPVTQNVWQSESEQRVRSQEIRARTPHQVFVADVRSVPWRLQVTRRQELGKDVIEVCNLLESPVRQAFVCFGQDLYGVRDLAPGAVANCELVSADADSISHVMEPAQILRWKPGTFDYQRWDTSNLTWGLCQEICSTPLEVRRRLRSGEYLCLLDEFAGAAELNSRAWYQPQLHLVHGNW